MFWITLGIAKKVLTLGLRGCLVGTAKQERPAWRRGILLRAHTGGACTNGVKTKEEHLETDRRGACAATRTERDGFTGKSLRSACAEESLEKIRSAPEGIAS